jgi:hypothetical protein
LILQKRLTSKKSWYNYHTLKAACNTKKNQT